MEAALQACLMTDEELAPYANYFREAAPPWAVAAAEQRQRLEEERMAEMAEAMLRKELALNEKTHGAEHPDTAAAVNNLALVLQDKGRVDEAEEMFRRVLAIFEKTHGPDHTDTAKTLNNLGS